MVYYDSKNPAPGVKVMPAGRDKVFLSESQAKQACKIPVDGKGEYTGRGVLRLKPIGGPHEARTDAVAALVLQSHHDHRAQGRPAPFLGGVLCPNSLKTAS